MVTCKGDYSETSYGTGNLFSSAFRGRIELSKYVYFCAQQSKIKTGTNKFQDLINAPRILVQILHTQEIITNCTTRRCALQSGCESVRRQLANI